MGHFVQNIFYSLPPKDQIVLELDMHWVVPNGRVTIGDSFFSPSESAIISTRIRSKSLYNVSLQVAEEMLNQT